MAQEERKDRKSIKIITSVDIDHPAFTIKGEDGKTITITSPQTSKKKVIKEDLSIRDENVQEILTSVPHWMIRWGNALFLLLVLVILFLSWLIKYPDTVSDGISIEKSAYNQGYIGVISSKNYSFEKVKKGQNVQISLFVYPEYENGVLLGIVDTVFWNKTSKMYITKINLTKDLVTTYGTKINPDTNLEGSATVIIKDKRLIEDFFRIK